ncbi:MAG: urea ABC transporter permease subunit UrtC [Planctomycetota bacterium]|nr:urea ABC transporter permease subunit UrtC [Planctomycetota bacterium]
MILAGLFALAIHLGGFLPEGSSLRPSDYTLTLLGKYLAYAILALSLDLVWGYLGILSLGHGAFFALGGYALGMHLMRNIGARGVYGNPELPDFMVFLNWGALPWYWEGMNHFALAAAMVPLIPALLAAVFGWLAFASRVSGVYFSIMSQALTYALMLAFFLNEAGFGGNNGLTDFKTLLGFDLHSRGMRSALFLASALALMGCYLVCRVVVVSRLGKVFTSIRDAESRTRFIGYRVERAQLAAFTLSAAMAGLGGALFVPQVGIINPGEFAPLKSIEAVIWVALGGRGRLYGAVIGAFAVNYAKTAFTEIWPDEWLFALGSIFVLVTLFLPDGLVGLFRRLLPARRPAGLNLAGEEREKAAVP